MPTYHTLDEMVAYLRTVPKERWRDGLIAYEPKRERRLAAEKRKQIRLSWPEHFQRRFVAAIEESISRYGPDTGREILCRRLEQPLKDEDVDSEE